MAEVKMIQQISGTRNGVDWPAPGETVDVPEWEAADLVSNGFAEPVLSGRAETRTAEPVKRATKTPRTKSKG